MKIILIFICFFVAFQFSITNVRSKTPLNIDYMTSIEAIYSNLNLINNSLQSLKKKTNILKWKLNKEIKSQKKINKQNLREINNNYKRISDIKHQFKNIDIDYKAVLKKIKEFEKSLSSIDTSLTEINYELKTLKENLNFLTADYFKLKKEFLKIPEIMFCENCLPSYTASFSLNKFLIFNTKDVNSTPSFSFDAIYNIDYSYSIWLNYITPFVVTISSTIDERSKISDHWNSNILSAGMFYNLNRSKKKKNNLSLTIGGGFFYSNLEYDKFLNSTFEFLDRKTTKATSSFGFNLRSELSYSEFYSKNPLELFVGINSFISFKNVVLDPGFNTPHDLGKIQIALILGMKFNFWGH